MVSFEWNENLAREVAAEEAEARGRREGEARGEARGKKTGIKEATNTIALSLLKDNTPLSKVVQWTKLPEAEVRQLARENGIVI